MGSYPTGRLMKMALERREYRGGIGGVVHANEVAFELGLAGDGEAADGRAEDKILGDVGAEGVVAAADFEASSWRWSKTGIDL